MIAVVMCGGRGSRLGLSQEKSMIELQGRCYVERVLDALEKSARFNRIVAAVSPNTPKTRQFLISKKIEIIDTPGTGYPHDLSFLLSRLAPEKVLVTPADIPLLTPEVISEALDLLAKETGPAVSIVFEKSFVEMLGLTPSVIVASNLCHSGVTLFDSGWVRGEVDETYVTMNRQEIAVNVNTKDEKELAELLVKDSNDFA